MKRLEKQSRLLAITAVMMCLSSQTVSASSHMDAPLITLDDAANTTDVYAFVTERQGVRYLTTALSVYPFEEPGIGPNKYNFDDNVLYQIHVSTGDDVAKGKTTLSYQFKFKTRFKNKASILQSYLGIIEDVDDASQNLTQSYRVTKVDRRKNRRTRLDSADQILLVPPNNQGIATPKYNVDNDGDNPARPGVDNGADLDTYTAQTVYDLNKGYRVFAGQRDDGFYADIQGVFDLLEIESPTLGLDSPNKPFDSQAGFNVHTIVLQIPLRELGGDQQIVGVHATTSRRQFQILRGFGRHNFGRWVQISRQGNPLFNEALVALNDKDVYSRTSPRRDTVLFRKYAETPELAGLLNALRGTNAITTNRTDIAGIFIPDLIKVDVSTAPAKLAGETDDTGFHRLGIFGGDVLTSQIQAGFGNGTVPGGWPNGRRFGDDVVDIAVCALLSDLRDVNALSIACDETVDIDGVVGNDISYNKVMPYAATALNGRNHSHH
ncbi:MAG TPA: DUF4331 domain-containing protein [Crenotrichaceae bacterium]|nr:DUF4331 domain-containing protein [Crenotrichaceae bacterium]